MNNMYYNKLVNRNPTKVLFEIVSQLRLYYGKEYKTCVSKFSNRVYNKGYIVTSRGKLAWTIENDSIVTDNKVIYQFN